MFDFGQMFDVNSLRVPLAIFFSMECWMSSEKVETSAEKQVFVLYSRAQLVYRAIKSKTKRAIQESVETPSSLSRR